MIEYKGAEAIANSLPKNKTLRVLDLAINNIGNTGAKAIGEILKDNYGLSELNLCIII